MVVFSPLTVGLPLPWTGGVSVATPEWGQETLEKSLFRVKHHVWQRHDGAGLDLQGNPVVPVHFPEPSRKKPSEKPNSLLR